MQEKILTESDERAHLVSVRAKIRAELDEVAAQMDSQSSDLRELKKYLSENKSDMDHIEKVSGRQTVDELSRVGDHSKLGAVRLFKLLKSPYFGRLDFKPANAPAEHLVYVGIHSFYDPAARTYLIHDWRAPISSMFYDFEHGAAHYIAPAGTVRGEILRKRQYRIEDGEMVFMLESSLNIHDGVLQEELSRTASDKMKNIVATIQRDQNAIIRNDSSRVLIIQGAAGSGKTSIALHRIAFLLYRFKDTITADDILIISPNKVFANYISSVLPELGEENIKETTMEVLATRLLGLEYQFQTFYEQVSELFNPKAHAYRERIQFKASLPFLEKLDTYIRHLKNANFTAADLEVARYKIPGEVIAEQVHRMGAMTFAARINDIVDSVAKKLEREHSYEIKAKDRDSIRKQLKKMFGSTNIDALYKGFYAWLEEPGMFKFAAKGVYEYSDIYPLIYFKMQMEGMESFDEVKHLVVDEMQDYTPVQYTVLSQLFPCKKTILGDANQSVNPLSSSRAEGIKAILTGAECVYLNQSYRSTLQISNLAQRINRNPDLVPIERHGAEPEIIACADLADEVRRIREALSRYLASGHKSCGIVCKTQDAANLVYEQVKDLSEKIYVIDPTSVAFNQGVTIATAHLAKGLEFDEVILPFCNEETYSGVIDRHMLYVGVTRAMHRLTLTYAGKLTPFLAG